MWLIAKEVVCVCVCVFSTTSLPIVCFLDKSTTCVFLVGLLWRLCMHCFSYLDFSVFFWPCARQKQKRTSPFNLLKPKSSHFESLFDGTFCVSKHMHQTNGIWCKCFAYKNNASFVKPSVNRSSCDGFAFVDNFKQSLWEKCNGSCGRARGNWRHNSFFLFFLLLLWQWHS